MRSRWIINHGDEEADPDARTIENPKANYGPTGGKIDFRWHQGSFVRGDDLPADYAKELADSIRVSRENEIFLDCLREREKQGEGRLVGPSSGSNYAPSQFEGMSQAKGLKRTALKRAMDRLYTIGRIESYTYRNTSKGRDVTVIREVKDAPRTQPRTAPDHTSRTPPNSPPERPPAHTPIPKGISGAATEAAAPIEKGPAND